MINKHNIESCANMIVDRDYIVEEERLVDVSYGVLKEYEEPGEDIIRIYVPLNISKSDILRRLEYVIYRNGAASERNESNYWSDVLPLIDQIEIYDQVWVARHGMKEGEISSEAKELVREFVELLDGIEDECAELFPFELIHELNEDYLHMPNHEW